MSFGRKICCLIISFMLSLLPSIYSSSSLLVLQRFFGIYIGLFGCNFLDQAWIIRCTKEGLDTDKVWGLLVAHLLKIIGIFWIVGPEISLDPSRSFGLLFFPFSPIQTLAITKDGDLDLPLSLNPGKPLLFLLFPPFEAITQR